MTKALPDRLNCSPAQSYLRVTPENAPKLCAVREHRHSTMELPRRRFLHLAVGAIALPTASRFARAQAYPARPVRWIVGYAAGGGNDIAARLMGQWLAERLGQPFV